MYRVLSVKVKLIIPLIIAFTFSIVILTPRVIFWSWDLGMSVCVNYEAVMSEMFDLPLDKQDIEVSAYMSASSLQEQILSLAWYVLWRGKWFELVSNVFIFVKSYLFIYFIFHFCTYRTFCLSHTSLWLMLSVINMRYKIKDYLILSILS